MNKAHQIKLYPTKSQEKLLRQSCGVARFAYNWALNKWQEDYKNGIKQTAYDLIKHLNSIKRTEFVWMQDTGKTCSQYAIHNLEAAYKKMWKEKSGYPKFKKKGVKDSFVAVENSNAFRQENFRIKIPRIGWIKCSENLRFEGKVNNVTIKRIANIWIASVNIISNETPVVCENQATIGVDLGVKTLIVLSDGKTFDNPKAIKKSMKGLKRLQRGLSRKKKGSNNWWRQQMNVAKKHYRISCIRKAAINDATSYISKHYGKVIIEELKVKDMVKNHKLAQAINDASFGEISRQLYYKCQWNGVELVKANQWFPSSKICSCCGNKKKDLKLSEREYMCENCGLEIDRDLNAAINLANYSPTSKYEGSKACGEGSSVAEMQHSPLMKHEIIELSNSLKNYTLE